MRAFVLLALSLAAAGVAFACGCNYGLVPEGFAQAEKVFRAEVLSTDKIPSDPIWNKYNFSKRYRIRAAVRITRTYKGNTDNLKYVYTSTSNCGLNIRPGDDWVFFTDSKSEAHLCSGSLAARQAPGYKVDWQTYLASIEAQL